MLLEIGMRISFLVPKAHGQGGFTPHDKLDIVQILKSKNEQKKRLDIKRRLTKLAKEVLPTVMGRRYMEVVYTCLTCLDKSKRIFDIPRMVNDDDSSSDGDDDQDAGIGVISEDDYDVTIGVQFIQQVGKFQSFLV